MAEKKKSTAKRHQSRASDKKDLPNLLIGSYGTRAVKRFLLRTVGASGTHQAICEIRRVGLIEQANLVRNAVIACLASDRHTLTSKHLGVNDSRGLKTMASLMNSTDDDGKKKINTTIKGVTYAGRTKKRKLDADETSSSASRKGKKSKVGRPKKAEKAEKPEKKERKKGGGRKKNVKSEEIPKEEPSANKRGRGGGRKKKEEDESDSVSPPPSQNVKAEEGNKHAANDSKMLVEKDGVDTNQHTAVSVKLEVKGTRDTVPDVVAKKSSSDKGKKAKKKPSESEEDTDGEEVTDDVAGSETAKKAANKPESFGSELNDLSFSTV